MKYIIISQHGWHIVQEDLNQPGALEQLAGDIGITQWVEDFTEDKNHGLGHHYPQGTAMLLKVEAVIPEPVQVVTQWKLP